MMSILVFSTPAVDCGELESPSNGDVQLTGTTFGSVATYTCMEGFKLANGDQRRECDEDGLWTGEPPICVRIGEWKLLFTQKVQNFILYTCIMHTYSVIVCPPLRDPTFGRVRLSGNTPGSTATYTCVDRYELDGEPTRTCQSNGQWSGDAPTCTRKSEMQTHNIMIVITVCFAQLLTVETCQIQ